MEKVCVLMSTYNGEKYLNVQIDSILAQKDVEIKIIVRDDGSVDNTVNILQEYNKKNELEYYVGDNLKPAHSFMELLYNAPDADYYAFADQDDFWYENKLIKAIQCMDTVENECIYFSNVEIVDRHLNCIQKCNKLKKNNLAVSFVDSPAIGCTMIINKKMREKIIEKNINGLEIGLHDSWIYRVGICIGATIIYDKNSYIKYRQHENNVIGAKKRKTIKQKFQKVFGKKKKYKGIVAKNILELYSNIDEENKQILNAIVRISEGKATIKEKILILLNKKFKSNDINADIKFVCDVLKNNL